MGSSRKASNNPKKRTLVRWDENLNELLLLTVQSVCNAQGIRIPWGEVAKTMGNNVSEGAIVQHLAKLRVRRVAANKDVPPPLRRGGTGAAPKPPASDAVAGPSTEASEKSKSKSKKKDSDEESISSAASDTASDEEYGKKRRAKKTKKTKNKKAKRESKEVDVKSEPVTDEESEGRDRQISVDDRGNDLVAIGAQFLSYPNDKNLPSSPTSSESSVQVPKRTKVVTLRIRQGLEKFADQRVSGVQNMESMVPSHPNVNRSSPGNSYQSVATATPTSVQSHDDLLGFPGFDSALHGNQTVDSAMSMGSAIGYGDLLQISPIQGHGHSAVYQPLQSMPLNPYAELHRIGDHQMLEPPSMFNPALLNSSHTNIIEDPLFPGEQMNPYSGMMWTDSMEDPNMLS